MTFNIGYCGLDKDQDFFADGGRTSRSRNRAQTLANLAAIESFLVQEQPDLILLQEVDIRSSRSQQINQLAAIKQKLSRYGSVFAWNYQIPWVPVPWLRPMGSVYSGLVVLSRYQTARADRVQYPGQASWPRRLFELDRCLAALRLPAAAGRDLVLINSHLSAFDFTGRIVAKQLAFLKEFIDREYRQGSWVIVGGDWNHILPGTDPALFQTTEQRPRWLRDVPADFTPHGFIWSVDRNVPTVRSASRPYMAGKNYTAVIDGFLVSPNVKLHRTAGHPLNFRNSDHNPVTGWFELDITFH